MDFSCSEIRGVLESASLLTSVLCELAAGVARYLSGSLAGSSLAGRVDTVLVLAPERVVLWLMVTLLLLRTFLSGLSRTTRSFGKKRQDRMTVALRLKHMASVVS